MSGLEVERAQNRLNEEKQEDIASKRQRAFMLSLDLLTTPQAALLEEVKQKHEVRKISEMHLAHLRTPCCKTAWKQGGVAPVDVRHSTWRDTLVFEVIEVTEAIEVIQMVM